MFLEKNAFTQFKPQRLWAVVPDFNSSPEVTTAYS